MSHLVLQIALVAIGGALGGIGRVWLSERVTRLRGGRFPWGTLLVNVSGAAAIGVLAAFLIAPDGSLANGETLRLALIVGVLGSYTTVSSFSLQTLVLLQAGEPLRALANIAASTGFALAAVSAGYFAASMIMRLVT